MPIQQIDSTEIVATIREGLLVLTEDLVVEFASPNFFRVFDLAAKETIGVPIHKLGDGQWAIPALHQLLGRIIPENITIEAFEVEADFKRLERRTIRLNARKIVRPGNNSKRILIALEDVTEARLLERELERQRRLAQGIVDTVREPLLVLDGKLSVIAASRSFYTTFKVSERETIGFPLSHLGSGQWNIPRLTELLQRIIPDNTTMEDFEVRHDFPMLGHRTILLNARKIYRDGNNTKTFLLAMEDVTDRRRAEAEREEALEQAKNLLRELNHRVMNSLGIIGAIIGLEARSANDAECRAALGRMQTRITSIAQLHRNLTRSKTVSTVSADVYLNDLLRDLVESLTAASRPVKTSFAADHVELSTDLIIPLGMIVNEVMTNSLKHAFEEQADGRVSLEFKASDGHCVLALGDNGSGSERAYAGGGLGRKLIETFVHQLRGSLEVSNSPEGTKVTVAFPLARARAG
ncbi:MAG: histidine kinase dimerization/phosphoacceptor domain -containing protein [Xanthobacteraceae bacterium]